MSPNLLVLALTCVRPHRWFRKSHPAQLNITEEWSCPVPGRYEHKPASGWYLIATQDPKISSEFIDVPVPRKVIYIRCLHRYIFEDEANIRTRRGVVVNSRNVSRRSSIKSQKMREDLPSHARLSPTPQAMYTANAGHKEQRHKTKTFFRLDDGITWVWCFDRFGRFIPGPYEPFVLVDGDDDSTTQVESRFRPMLKCDVSAWRQRDNDGRDGDGAASHPQSFANSLYCQSGKTTLAGSRDASSADIASLGLEQKLAS